MKKMQNYTTFRIDIDNQEKHNCNCSIVTDNRKGNDAVLGCKVDTMVVSVWVILILYMMIFFLLQQET